ncbi:MAG: hypothetical protein R2854_16230 [Caldilineaceae bacterium]
MRERPVVLGHEVSLTVVDVGENLRDQYHVGDRFIVQADIYIDGLSRAYGYEIQGGFSEYNIIDQRAQRRRRQLSHPRRNDDRLRRIRAQRAVGVRGSVVRGRLPHPVAGRRRGLVDRDGAGATLGAATDWRPRAVVIDASDADFAATVRDWAAGAGVDVIEDDGAMQFDDIVILGHDPDLIGAPLRGWPRAASSTWSRPRRCPDRSAWTSGACTTTIS